MLSQDLITDYAINEIMQLVRYIGKEPVRVGDCAGFVVDLLFFSCFGEALRIVSEGIATFEDIDKAVKLGLSYLVGVFQLQDIGGLDLALAVRNVLYEEYGERFKPSPLPKKGRRKSTGKKDKKRLA